MNLPYRAWHSSEFFVPITFATCSGLSSQPLSSDQDRLIMSPEGSDIDVQNMFVCREGRVSHFVPQDALG